MIKTRARFLVIGVRHVIILAIFFTFTVANSAAVSPLKQSDDNELAFTKSMELLEIQMKTKVLHILLERGFYVPIKLLKTYYDEQGKLNDELSSAMDRDMGVSFEWLDQIQKVGEAESSIMLKTAEWTLGKLKEIAKGELKEKKQVETVIEGTEKISKALKESMELEKKIIKWKSNKAWSSYDIAVYVYDVIDARLQNRQLGEKLDKSLLKLFRGAIQDRKNIVGGIKALDEQRMLIDARLKTLASLESKMKVIEFLNKDHVDKVKDFITDQLIKYAKERYIIEDQEIFEKNVKSVINESVSLVQKVWSTASDLKELDKDRILSTNPTALKFAKGFVKLGLLYELTLKVLKKIPGADKLGPLFDFLEYYGEAILLVPKVAQKMAVMVDRMDQGYLGYRKMSAWADLPDPPYLSTSLMNHFQLQIATSGEINEEQENARFYILVPKELNSNKYLEFNKGQYDRLAQALADERIIFGREEASGSYWKLFKDRISGTRTDSPLSPEADEDYLKELTIAARKLSIEDKDMVKLASGQEIDYKGGKWTAEKLRNRCETEITLMARELLIRESLKEFDVGKLEQWQNFKALLTQNKVVFNQDSIFKLFGYYVTQGDAKIKDFLKYRAKELAKKRGGRIEIGIPLVTIPPSDKVKPDTKVELAADIITGGLAARAEISGELTWILPEWAKEKEQKQNVQLRNGAILVKTDLFIPKAVDKKPFQLTVKLNIPATETRDAIEAAGEGTFEFEEAIVLPPPQVEVILKDNKPTLIKVTIPDGIYAPLKENFKANILRLDDPPMPGARKDQWNSFGQVKTNVFEDKYIEDWKTYKYKYFIIEKGEKGEVQSDFSEPSESVVTWSLLPPYASKSDQILPSSISLVLPIEVYNRLYDEISKRKTLFGEELNVDLQKQGWRLIKYNWYRAEGSPKNDYQRLDLTEGSPRTYEDKKFEYGKKYYYRYALLDKNGAEKFHSPSYFISTELIWILTTSGAPSDQVSDSEKELRKSLSISQTGIGVHFNYPTYEAKFSLKWDLLPKVMIPDKDYNFNIAANLEMFNPKDKDSKSAICRLYCLMSKGGWFSVKENNAELERNSKDFNEYVICGLHACQNSCYENQQSNQTVSHKSMTKSLVFRPYYPNNTAAKINIGFRAIDHGVNHLDVNYSPDHISNIYQIAGVSDWMPDQKRALVVSKVYVDNNEQKNKIFFVDLSTGEIKKLFDNDRSDDGNASWLPDGKVLFFKWGQNRWFVMNSDGSNVIEWEEYKKKK
ncbi:MAG: hypothetical protein HY606_07860 [Planctomycetes bacterium]|nr:hypothetical protein [Planctomycetota bacterium]